LRRTTFIDTAPITTMMAAASMPSSDAGTPARARNVLAIDALSNVA
jgi:hypothetical protein